MNILDENVRKDQVDTLRNKRVSVKKIGDDIGRIGMKDEQIIPLLHSLDRPTLFTLDTDFYDRRLCHEGYCLVHLDIEDTSVAEFVRRILRHRRLRSKANRMGCVIRAEEDGLTVWRFRHVSEEHLSWE